MGHKESRKRNSFRSQIPILKGKHENRRQNLESGSRSKPEESAKNKLRRKFNDTRKRVPEESQLGPAQFTISDVELSKLEAFLFLIFYGRIGFNNSPAIRIVAE